jgi:hypothetical protein
MFFCGLNFSAVLAPGLLLLAAAVVSMIQPALAVLALLKYAPESNRVSSLVLWYCVHVTCL